jgi:hypothetical protein
MSVDGGYEGGRGESGATHSPRPPHFTSGRYVGQHRSLGACRPGLLRRTVRRSMAWLPDCGTARTHPA